MKLKRLFAALLLATPLALANELPNLGDASQQALPPQQERALGENIMLSIRGDRAYEDDAEVIPYLNSLGYRLAANSPENTVDFEFFLIRDNTLNAFALPGGFIGVHTGLILAAQTESELASVLAHEIAHVTQRHIARMVAKQQQSSLATLAALAVAILASRSNGQVAEAALATAQASSVQTQLDFTRVHEREADRVGLQILDKSGFDTQGMVAFFGRLQKFGRIYENNAPAYLRTHPLTTERIADIENRVAPLPYRQVADNPEFQFLRAKLRAGQGDARDALKDFEESLKEKKYNNEAAHRYGYARALLRNREFARAEKEVVAQRKSQPNNVLIENLYAEIRLTQNDLPTAISRYRAALGGFPGNPALSYGLANALLRNHQPADAQKFVEERLKYAPNDYHLYELLAQSWAAQGKHLLKHQAEAEAYVRFGNLTAAIEQLQLALRAGDGDFYQLSIIEARLKDLRRIDSERKP